MMEYTVTGHINPIVKAEFSIKDTSITTDVTKELIFLMNVKNLQIKVICYLVLILIIKIFNNTIIR